MLRVDEEVEVLGDEASFMERAPVVIPNDKPTTWSSGKPKWVLQKLTARHRRIVNLKIAGLTREEVAKQADCRPEYVSLLLSQPLVKEYLQSRYNDLDADLKDLVGPAIDTMRDMLTSGDDKVALSAARTVLQANGKLSGEEKDERVTAEDVVAKLLQQHAGLGTVNVQVNNYRKD